MRKHFFFMRRLVFILTLSCISLTAASSATYAQGPNQLTNIPLIKWLSQANDLRSKGAIDFAAPAEFAVDADLGPDCRLSHVVIEQKAGDRQLYPVIESLVAAIEDSGLLSLFGDREGQDVAAGSCVSMPVRFTFKSDSVGVDATAGYGTSASDRALRIAKAYESLIHAARTARTGHPDKLIYEGLSATAEAERVIIHFHTSREKLDSLITDLLQPH